jgi:hypothetical protein
LPRRVNDISPRFTSCPSDLQTGQTPSFVLLEAERISVKRPRAPSTEAPLSWPRSASTPGWTARAPSRVPGPASAGDGIATGTPSRGHAMRKRGASWGSTGYLGGLRAIVEPAVPQEPPGAPSAGQTSPPCGPQALHCRLPLMPPASRPPRLGAVRPPEEPGPHTPAVARTPDRAPAPPHPIPCPRPAPPPPRALPRALVLMAVGTGPARRLGCGPTAPNRARARPQPGHAAASARCTARAGNASRAGSPGPLDLWHALHTGR